MTERCTRPGRLRHRWTAADDAEVRARYGALPLATLAARLDRSPHAVTQRASRLRLDARREADEPIVVAGDGWRLAVLLAYRLRVVDAAEAAVVLGVPVARLPVEVGKAAACGQAIVAQALGRTG